MALLDARRGEVYAGAFQREGEQADPSASGGRLHARGADRAAAGALPAGRARARALVRRAAARRARPGRDARAPRAGCAREPVAELGARLLAQGAGIPAAELVPRYLRRAEAEVRRTGERFEAAADDGPTGRF